MWQVLWKVIHQRQLQQTALVQGDIGVAVGTVLTRTWANQAREKAAAVALAIDSNKSKCSWNGQWNKSKGSWGDGWRWLEQERQQPEQWLKQEWERRKRVEGWLEYEKPQLINASTPVSVILTQPIPCCSRLQFSSRYHRSVVILCNRALSWRALLTFICPLSNSRLIGA